MSDFSPAGPRIAPTARTVDAGRAVDWFVTGWHLFLKNPGGWIAISVILLVGMFALSIIPLLGQIAVLLMLPIAGGGLVLGCKALHEGGELRVEHLFEGFQRSGTPLAVIGALYAAGGMLAFGIALLIGGGSAVGGAITQGWPGAGVAAGGFLLGALVYLTLSTLLAMAFWFAPTLVVLHGVSPVDAMKASMTACLHNFLPFTVFGILATIAGFLAMLPAGLGLLVLAPILVGAAYASYLDVFA